MKRLRRFLLFANTAWTSAFNEYLITGRVKWRLGLNLISVLCSRKVIDRKPGSFWWRRVKACGKCPIYDHSRRACGLLDQTVPTADGREEPLGCGCFIPIKAGVRDAQCFLYVISDGEHGVNWNAMDASKSEL